MKFLTAATVLLGVIHGTTATAAYECTYDTLEETNCSGKNELGQFSVDAATCATYCDNDPTCVSFETHTNGDCHLSTSCKPGQQQGGQSGWTLKFKQLCSIVDPKFSCSYDSYANTACDARNELVANVNSDPESCQAYCDNDPLCVSFEMVGAHCQLSSSCTTGHMSTNNGYTLRVKTGCENSEISCDYLMYEQRACVDRNELGEWSPTDFESCKTACDETYNCVAFEYIGTTNRCQLSTSCTAALSGSYDDHLLGIKTGCGHATSAPTLAPTDAPTADPTSEPTAAPTSAPTTETYQDQPLSAESNFVLAIADHTLYRCPRDTSTKFCRSCSDPSRNAFQVCNRPTGITQWFEVEGFTGTAHDGTWSVDANKVLHWVGVDETDYSFSITATDVRLL